MKFIIYGNLNREEIIVTENILVKIKENMGNEKNQYYRGA